MALAGEGGALPWRGGGAPPGLGLVPPGRGGAALRPDAGAGAGAADPAVLPDAARGHAAGYRRGDGAGRRAGAVDGRRAPVGLGADAGPPRGTQARRGANAADPRVLAEPGLLTA